MRLPRVNYGLTLTRHKAIPSLLRVQNRDRRVLGQRDMIGFVMALGRAGTVHNWRAAEVGKYMVLIHAFDFTCSAGRTLTSRGVMPTRRMLFVKWAQVALKGMRRSQLLTSSFRILAEPAYHRSRASNCQYRESHAIGKCVNW